jgi:hypothetical protein
VRVTIDRESAIRAASCLALYWQDLGERGTRNSHAPMVPYERAIARLTGLSSSPPPPHDDTMGPSPDGTLAGVGP